MAFPFRKGINIDKSLSEVKKNSTKYLEEHPEQELLLGAQDYSYSELRRTAKLLISLSDAGEKGMKQIIKRAEEDTEKGSFVANTTLQEIQKDPNYIEKAIVGEAMIYIRSLFLNKKMPNVHVKSFDLDKQKDEKINKWSEDLDKSHINKSNQVLH